MTSGSTSDRSVPNGVPMLPRVDAPAHVIKTADEAISIAEELAASFRQEASVRDRERRWPVREMDTYSQSGLWAMNVPKAFGGPELSYATIVKVTEIISAADPNIGQIPQNHLGIVAAINTVSDKAQQEFFFAEALRGTRFGNAFSEFGSKRATEFQTKFVDHGDHVIVNGKKF